MDSSKFVIVGGGMVAGYAAKQFVELGLKPGELTILSADDVVPYERPPLSKKLLLGTESESSILINPDDFYREHGIAIRLGTTIAAVDTSRRRLALQGGGEFGFEHLMIATGCSARTLTVPGAQLANIFYLRSMGDSLLIRQKARGARRAVVIGGGFIGMEVASVLNQMGIETTVTMREERVWMNFATPEMSRFFEGYYTDRGVKFVHGVDLTELRGTGHVDAAVLVGGKTGDGQTIPCDLVIGGIGARPATEFLANSGIELDNGVTVNEYLETSAPSVLAAGDVANYPDLIFGKRRRAEHWDNAVSQGQHCARSLMGERAPFRHAPYFFSDIFDLSYELWGDTAGHDQVVYRGDVTSKSFSAWWLKQGILCAAFVMNRPDEERNAAAPMVEAQRAVDAARLADEATPVAQAV